MQPKYESDVLEGEMPYVHMDGGPNNYQFYNYFTNPNNRGWQAGPWNIKNIDARQVPLARLFECAPFYIPPEYTNNQYYQGTAPPQQADEYLILARQMLSMALLRGQEEPDGSGPGYKALVNRYDMASGLAANEVGWCRVTHFPCIHYRSEVDPRVINRSPDSNLVPSRSGQLGGYECHMWGCFYTSYPPDARQVGHNPAWVPVTFVDDGTPLADGHMNPYSTTQPWAQRDGWPPGEGGALEGTVNVDVSLLRGTDSLKSLVSALRITRPCQGSYIWFRDLTLSVVAQADGGNNYKPEPLAGCSFGLALAVCILGGPPLAYTGYVKALGPHLRNRYSKSAYGADPKGYYGSIIGGYPYTGPPINADYYQVASPLLDRLSVDPGFAQQRKDPNSMYGTNYYGGFVPAAAADDVVEDVQGLPFKIYFAYQMGFPLIIPHRSSFGNNVYQLMDQLRSKLAAGQIGGGLETAFMLDAVSGAYSTVQSDMGIAYSSPAEKCPILLATTLPEAVQLGIIAFMHTFRTKARDYRKLDPSEVTLANAAISRAIEKRYENWEKGEARRAAYSANPDRFLNEQLAAANQKATDAHAKRAKRALDALEAGKIKRGAALEKRKQTAVERQTYKAARTANPPTRQKGDFTGLANLAAAKALRVQNKGKLYKASANVGFKALGMPKAAARKAFKKVTQGKAKVTSNNKQLKKDLTAFRRQRLAGTQPVFAQPPQPASNVPMGSLLQLPPIPSSLPSFDAGPQGAYEVRAGPVPAPRVVDDDDDEPTSAPGPSARPESKPKKTKGIKQRRDDDTGKPAPNFGSYTGYPGLRAKDWSHTVGAMALERIKEFLKNSTYKFMASVPVGMPDYTPETGEDQWANAYTSEGYILTEDQVAAELNPNGQVARMGTQDDAVMARIMWYINQLAIPERGVIASRALPADVIQALQAAVGNYAEQLRGYLPGAVGHAYEEYLGVNKDGSAKNEAWPNAILAVYVELHACFLQVLEPFKGLLKAGRISQLQFREIVNCLFLAQKYVFRGVMYEPHIWMLLTGDATSRVRYNPEWDKEFGAHKAISPFVKDKMLWT